MSYLKKVFSTGAVRKTPFKVIKRITALINADKPLSIIELGAGRGEITKAVINKIHNLKSYLAFEIDKDCCQKLSADFPQIKVVEEDAFLFNKHLNGVMADLVMCSIPLSFYKKEKIENLLETIKESLKPGGRFVIIFHAFWLLPLLRKKFPAYRMKVFTTLPVYFLLSSTAEN